MQTTREAAKRAASLLALALAVSVVPAASASATTYVPEDGQRLYRPQNFFPANHTGFSKVHWLAWTGTRAVAHAHGRTYYPGGTPFGGEVTVVLARPRSICGVRFFTQAHWTYKGRAPLESHFMRLGCGGYWTGA